MSRGGAAAAAQNAHAQRGRFAREERKIFRGRFRIDDAVAFTLGEARVGHGADTKIVDGGKLLQNRQQRLRAQCEIRADHLNILVLQLHRGIRRTDIAVGRAFFGVGELRHNGQAGKRPNRINGDEQFFDVRKGFKDVEINAALFEQALALEERGVDFYILETFSYIEELLLAIDAIRSFSGLPVVAQLTYAEEGTTHGDVRPSDAAAQLKNKNVQVIGANCTLGPQALLPILQELAAVDGLRVSGMPNAGFPKREGDRIVYPKSSPEYFALFAREAAALGVRILGGCCGTTPAHIRAMAEAVKSLRPAKTHPAAGAVEMISKPAPVVQRDPESRFWKRLQARKFTVCVEIDPPKGLSLDRIFEQVEKVMASGKVDAIDINSGAMARVGMDALIVAGALEARGVETVPHLTTRDQNIIGLQAALLGAWTVGGVRNVLAITGDPPSVGD